MIDYRRVLLVMTTKVKQDDTSNLQIRALFSQWPKEQLAQIYSGDGGGIGDFCGTYYQLGPQDRVFGRIFDRLKPSAMELIIPATVSDENMSIHPLSALKVGIRKLAEVVIVQSGIWELLFHIRISPAMDQFIRDFQPEVIYCQGYSIGFAILPVLLARQYQLPLCFHTTDDWPECLYRYSPVHLIVKRCAWQLIKQANLHLSFGAKMTQVYQQRYRVPFHQIDHLDDWERFRVPAWYPDDDPTPRIIYSGSILSGRHESLVDLVKAVRHLHTEIGPLRIDVYCSGLPHNLDPLLREAPEVHFYQLPKHDQLPAIYAGAAIIFIAESFHSHWYNNWLSVSSKCHLAMMSQRPTIVYAPVWNGSVDYALREGWAYGITERDVNTLKEAIRQLLTQPDITQQYIEKTEPVVRRYHDLHTIRQQFAQMITNLKYQQRGLSHD